MKRLTITRIASASLRCYRRAYVSMALGIFLSIALITGMCLAMQGLAARWAEKADARVGTEDAVLFDSGMTDQQVLALGLFAPEIGHLYVAGNTDKDFAVGWYDETGETMLCRGFIEGRMPEAPGEIAAETTALIAEGLPGAAVGDALTLTVAPLDGVPEERTFTLVGILTEQSDRFNVQSHFGLMNAQACAPAMVFHRDEPAFATGRVAQVHLLNFLPGVTALDVVRGNDKRLSPFFCKTNDGEWQDLDLYFRVYQSDMFEYLTIVALLTGALILAACVGIANAMESQLARKTEEIGMLRAVGATKRQIRRIFGREAWLLALLLTPPAMALGALGAYGLSVFLPDLFSFRLNVETLLPILLLSVAAIVLSAFLPLCRASRAMPMGVLRDADILRRASRLRPKQTFRVPALLSLRELRFHPTRPLGAALLTALMLFFAAGLCHIIRSNVDTAVPYAFSLSNDLKPGFGTVEGGAPFVDAYSAYPLSDGDLAQIAALPGVKDVDVQYQVSVTLPVARLTDYLRLSHVGSHLSTPFLTDDLTLDPPLEEAEARMQESAYGPQLNAVRRLLNTDEIPLVLPVRTCSEEKLLDMAARADAGQLDLAAVNAGRQVLVGMPDIYVYHPESNNMLYMSVGPGYNPREHYGEPTMLLRDDSFAPGMTLPLTQFCVRGDPPGLSETSLWSEDACAAYYEGLERHDAKVAVGAVSHMDAMGLYTTREGLAAMGFNADTFSQLNVSLRETPDAEAEAYLEQQLSLIAARDPNLSLSNDLTQMRARQADFLRSSMTTACVTLVLFAVAAGQIGGTVSRRIRADSRTIGILRAAGANSRTLAGCYCGGVLLSVGLGLLGGLACLLVYNTLNRAMDVSDLFRGAEILSMTAFAAALLVVCLLTLRLRVREAVSRSVVENIREL